MPDIPYPKPPQPTEGLLSGDPTKVLSAIGQLNALQKFQAEFGAKQALGQAWQRNLRPDGTPDLEGVSRDIKADPRAAYGAPEATGTLLDQHGKMIANATAQFEQSAKQNQFLMDGIGTLMNKPDLSRKDVNHFITTAARNTSIPSPILTGWLNGVPNGGKALRDYVTTIGNMAIGTGGTAARVTGQPTASGAPTTAPLGAVNYSPGAMPVAQPPGEPEAQQSSAARGAALRATANTSPQIHADLENLKHESRVLGDFSGPTSEAEKKLNSLSQRVFGAGVTLSKDQLAAADSFDKIVSQIATNQSKTLHGSDASLSAIQHANPNLQMSAAGRDMVIDMLHGNQDAIDVTRKGWADARAKGVPMHAHDDFMEEFGKILDPRVFQFNRLSRENQQKFLNQMDPAEVGDFEQKYQAAIDRKWVKPLKRAAP